MRHFCCPETMTIEQLAAWLTDNASETIDHTETFTLDADEIAEHEHKSATASRSIQKLQEFQKQVMKYLKDGTPDVALAGEEEVQKQPVDITIPPTYGFKILNSRLKFHNDIINKGEREEITKIYIIPYPDGKQMVGVDIEGKEWPQYTKAMTSYQEDQYGTMFAEDDGKEKKKKGKKTKAELDKKIEDAPALDL